MTDVVDLDDIEIIDTVAAYSIEVGDQIIVEGDYVEVKEVRETEDVNEVVVVGYSHVSGDTVTYELFADDQYDLWSV